MKNLTDIEALDTAIPRLLNSRQLASALQSVGIATPENPATFEHVAEAGQPLLIAASIAQWRQAGHVDSAVWVVCPHVKAQEIVQAELAIWGVESLFLPEYEWAGFEESLPDPESAAERLAVLKEVHEALKYSFIAF